jgi:kynurenine formamidase
MARLIDLSHDIEHGMVTYGGMPGPAISDWLSRDASKARYAPGTTFQIGKIDLLANTGTYIDAPFHRFETAPDIAGYSLEAVADLPGLVVRATERHDRTIDLALFSKLDVKGKAVLVHTGWDAHWRTDEYSAGGHPFLTRAVAEHLVKAGAALVGIDSLNIDDTPEHGERPVHSTLLAAGIPICEHLADLTALPTEGFRFSAVPVKVKGMGTFPVRAYATVEDRAGRAQR